LSINKSLNILIVCEHASNRFGGEAVLPLHYFKLLSDANHNVYLITHSRAKPNLASIGDINHQHIEYIPDTFLHRFLNRFSQTAFSPVVGILAHLLTQLYQYYLVKKMVSKHRIDIVHEVAPVSPRQPSMMFGFGVPVVIGPMNGGMTYPPGVDYLATKSHASFTRFVRLFADMANILMPGKFFASTLVVANQRTHSALPKWRRGQVVELVENGVFSVKDEPAKPVQRDAVHLIYAGRLVDWKAVDILIDAVALCESTISFTIVGGGHERVALESYAKQKLGQCPNISFKFTGMIAFDEMNQYYDQADIFALSSLFECGGAVVLEAMSRGLPVVATAWGGPADYISKGTGFLVEPKSRDYMVAEFARLIDQLAQSPELRYEVGKAAIARVKSHFMWDVKIQQMLNIYQQAMTRK
jgi:glycosyltransferase involved in cell wall biosynthesis